MIQKRTPSPWKAEGHHNLVQRVNVVMNLQDKMNERGGSEDGQYRC